MARTTRTRLGLESLEVRENPAVTAVLNPSGVLMITGTGVADDVSIQGVGYGGGFNPPTTHLRVNVHNANGTTTYHTFGWSTVNSVEFFGLGGNDRFTNDSSKRLTAYGGEGRDDLQGGFGVDVLHGGNGNDRLYGGEGSDTLYGGFGDDYLSDQIQVGDITVWQGGTNYLHGGDGRDTLHGGSGADWLDGGDDGYADRLWGYGGADTFVRDIVLRGLAGVPFNLDGPEDFNSADGDRYAD